MYPLVPPETVSAAAEWVLAAFAALSAFLTFAVFGRF